MALDHPYHKDRFTYKPDSDTYRCPKDEVLSPVRGKFSRETKKRMYQAPKRICQACPVAGVCIDLTSGIRSRNNDRILGRTGDKTCPRGNTRLRISSTN